MNAVRVLPLGEVVRPIRPRVKPSDRPDLPFIGMEHVEAHSMKLLGTVPAATMKSSAVHFKPGDVLYGRLRPYLNKVYRPTFEGLCSAEFIVLPQNEGIDGRYLQYFLNSAAFVRYATHLNAGDRPRIDFDQVAPYQIPLPGVSEQGRIVAEIEKQFSRIDQAVANLKRVKDRLDGYKGAIISEAVGGRASANDGIVPNGWRRERLGDAVAKITSGSRDWSPYYGRGAAVFLLAQNVRPMSPDFSVVQRVDPPEADPARARSRVQRGDLLVTIVGANTGQACMVEELPGETFVCQSVALVRPKLAANAPYLSLWLNSPEHGRRYFDRCMYGQGRPHLGFDQLASMPIAIPPPQEQARIVAEVDRRLSIVREVEADVDANLKRAQALRQAVLTHLFGSTNQECGAPNVT